MVSIEEKLGQMFIIRMHDKVITKELETLIKDYHIGGISLYSKNYDSYDEMLSLINELKRLNNKYNNTPLFIALDQEGGRVNRLPKDFKNIVSAKKLGENKKYALEAGQITGELLYKLGINMNFAPVLDIQRYEDSHAIGDRCFGNTKEKVSENGITMMNSLKKEGIIPVIKHFPGHGLAKRDSHLFLPIVNEKIEKSDDLVPFINAINEKADAIMIGHLMIRKMDKIYPASLSKKVIKEFLIKKLNYNGLVITDDLKMKAVSLLYGYKRSVLKAINAGNNIILIGTDYETVIKCIDNIIKKMNNNIKNDIETSYNKIIDLKNKYNVNDNENEKFDINLYNEKINKLNEKIK